MGTSRINFYVPCRLQLARGFVQIVIGCGLIGFTLIGSADGAKRADGYLHVEIVDSKTGKPIAARMHLRNSRGRPVKMRLPGVDRDAGHFYIDGRISLPLRRGQYTFELESSPEYRTRSGHFEIDRHADDTKKIEMHRFANLAEEGWWGGDLDVERLPKNLPLAMRAEGIHVVLAPDTPLPNRHAVAMLPFAWDLPIRLVGENLKAAQLDAIGLIHRHALRDGVIDNEGTGRPRDRSLFPGHDGNGRWTETIYYHVLNCGLRIPPAAGSGAGANQNPIGTNRVYVFLDEEFSEERWWEGLVAGRTFVTNGPLLRPSVRGKPPGYVFHLAEGEELTLEIGLKLATRVPVEYLEIIKNGEVEEEIRLSDWAKKGGRLPPIHFAKSGWFLIRAVTNDSRKYQFASTGPYYVEKGGQARISRRSVQFFLDWIEEASGRLETLDITDKAARQQTLADYAEARSLWQKRLEQANAK